MIQTVSGRKHLVVYFVPYIVSPSVTLIGVLTMSLNLINFQLNPRQNETFSSLDLNYMVLIAVFPGAWNLLYYLQVVPGLNVYVITVQRMLLDLLSFSIIFAMFFLSFSFAFYVLTDTSEEFLPLLYDIFRLTLNMIDLSRASGMVQFLHVAFVFTIVYLLQNIIIVFLVISACLSEQRHNFLRAIVVCLLLLWTSFVENYAPALQSASSQILRVWRR